MLFIGSIISSLDFLFTGISLNLSKKVTLSFFDNIKIFLITFIYYYLLLSLFIKFNVIIPIITKSILFFILSLYNLYKKEEKINLNPLYLITLSITNSIDGLLVAITFLHKYSIIFLTTYFSIISITLWLLGFYTLKTKKRFPYIISIIYIILGIISFF